MEMQRTFDGDLVPTAALPDDTVLCSDCSERRRADAYVDCRGNYHATDEERFDRDVEIVEEILNEHVEWATDYTRHEDYGDGYAYLVNESPDTAQYITEWLDNNDDDYEDQIERWDKFVAAVVDHIDACSECEAEFSYSEYAAYDGDGCCVESFEIGECEEQVEIKACYELRVLHEAGELDDILDSVNCEGYVSRSRRRVKNEETGCYELVGRETYNPHDSERPDIMLYHCPGGRWDFVIPSDRMRELVSEVIEEGF